MVTSIRNRGCVPYLDSEGIFLRPISDEKYKKDVRCEAISPFQRMHRHHTLASARRHMLFKNFSNLIPNDQLDFVLSSSYNQSDEIFPDTVDVYLQPESQGIHTWRRLRNTRDLTPDREEQAASQNVVTDGESSPTEKKKKSVIPYRYNFAHKVLIGGVTEKKHPSNIKLMNSSHHSPQTNAGYSRQPSDGNVYQY
ncbi:uncharacterized protein [Leptinotarsa decemlineata]|uniref:uncharacterized protein n=1 Tax=Leptinotarsa decemlineata TaxID=7539 RepID=UPI000C2554AE|nr:uncharacterized protein LOC111505105 [Leptinotarsa decemlineata]